MDNFGDLKMSGAGSCIGGKYNRVKLSGACEVNGDLECAEFHASGAAEVRGKIQCKSFSTSGAVEISGNVFAQDMIISGATEIYGDAEANSLRISGSSGIKGNLKVEDVVIHGGVNVGGDCSSKNFEAKGGFEIRGILKAEDINIVVGGYCEAKELRGKNINIKNVNDVNYTAGILSKVISFVSSKENKLITKTIEGDEIHIDNARVERVRGINVEIGEECVIGTVEYSGKLIKHPRAVINNEIKIG